MSWYLGRPQYPNCTANWEMQLDQRDDHMAYRRLELVGTVHSEEDG
jgi:hypothetical protein